MSNHTAIATPVPVGTTITCPTSEKLADGTLATILGCGSTNVTGPDDDGLFDCLDCGIWFDPARESAS